MRSIPVTGAFGRTRFDRKRDEKALKISDRNRISVPHLSRSHALAVEAGGTNGRLSSENLVFQLGSIATDTILGVVDYPLSIRIDSTAIVPRTRE